MTYLLLVDPFRTHIHAQTHFSYTESKKQNTIIANIVDGNVIFLFIGTEHFQSDFSNLRSNVETEFKKNPSIFQVLSLILHLNVYFHSLLTVILTYLG